MKTVYKAPSIKIVAGCSNSIICQSVGGNTGYDEGDLIGGGSLSDDD